MKLFFSLSNTHTVLYYALGSELGWQVVYTQRTYAYRSLLNSQCAEQSALR